MDIISKNGEVVKFDNSFYRLPDNFYSNVNPTPVKNPGVIKLNESLAKFLGFNLESVDCDSYFSGNILFKGSNPISMAYAGHQFGHWVPQLGDGRAVLLGEVIDTKGHRRDIQLKGSGPTPFSRMGDGRAWLGPILREYIVSEAMNKLNIPTTRALSAISTGEHIYREKEFPGAILTRVAHSHIRVGTFQYFSARQDIKSLKILADYVIERHYPRCKDGQNSYINLFKEIVKRQAILISKWMSVGFIHGVMNTDNTSIYGETIDYGPCAFLDEYDSNKVFSSIDQTGRYAYKNQPEIIRWNLACLASSLLPLIHDDEKQSIILAQNAVDEFPDLYKEEWLKLFRNKLGLQNKKENDERLIDSLLLQMEKHKTDFTLTFRNLCPLVMDNKESDFQKFRNHFSSSKDINNWLSNWKSRLSFEKRNKNNIFTFIKDINPAYIPRNHRIEEMINKGLEGDYSLFYLLNEILSTPFNDQKKYQEYQVPPKENQIVKQTFCGT